jgi:hypothetical protein
MVATGERLRPLIRQMGQMGLTAARLVLERLTFLAVAQVAAVPLPLEPLALLLGAAMLEVV